MDQDTYELHNLANSIILESKQDRPDSTLDSAILLLRQAREDRSASDPLRIDVLRHLSMALLTKFSQIGWVEDFTEALSLMIEAHSKRTMESAYPVCNVFPASVDDTFAYNETLCSEEQSEMTRLAVDMVNKFRRSTEISSVSTAIFLYYEALHRQLPTDSGRLSTVSGLVDALVIRFHTTEQHDDLDQAVGLLRNVQHLLPPTDPGRFWFLISLSACLCLRFDQSGQTQDMTDACVLFEEAMGEDDEASEALISGANMFSQSQVGPVSVLDRAVALLYKSLQLRPAPHPLRSKTVMMLSNALSMRFERKGQLYDLEESIALPREALYLLHAHHPLRSHIVNCLANGLYMLFKQKGRLSDLEESIALHREALDLRPTTHPRRPSSLNNLAIALSKRFERINQLSDLKESIAFCREALILQPTDHSGRYTSIHSLASALLTQFLQSSHLPDLEESVALHREALDSLPATHSQRSAFLHSLARALSMRFERKGQLSDFEESVALHREALDSFPTHHLHRPVTLVNLAHVLSMRYEWKGQLSDLEESIALHREALDLRPAPHPERSASLSSLAVALSVRCEQMYEPSVLEESITCHRQALHLRPAPHPARSLTLSNLANAYGIRFREKRRLLDLKQYVALHKDAVKLFPASHCLRYHALNNLAGALSVQFEQHKKQSDLEESIAHLREASELCPTLHPDRHGSLKNLARALLKLHTVTHQNVYLEDAMNAYRDATAIDTASIILQFRSSRSWANDADSYRHSSALEAYQCAINLLPRLVSLDLSMTARQAVLHEASGLACAACSYAVQAGKPEKAVEFLSAGRAVFWSQALQLRHPFEELRSVAPELEERLRNISNALEFSSLHNGSSTMHTMLSGSQGALPRDLEKEATRCRILNGEWNNTVNEVRALVGFEDFLRPKSFRKLQHAAAHGPIVMLNASECGCDALTVTQDMVKHIPLPGLTFKETRILGEMVQMALSGNEFTVHSNYTTPAEIQNALQTFAEQTRTSNFRMPMSRPQIRPDERLTNNDIFRSVLKMLWFVVVRPILRDINRKKSDSPARLWFCPTGPFAFLPIHAAGIYHDEGTECVSDYAIISYTPTLETLLVPPPQQAPTFKMLTVIQPITPHGPHLSHPTKELEVIEQHVPGGCLIKLGTEGTPTSSTKVLAHLLRASFVHFACHGIQDFVNPLESALLLSDGELKVSQLMEKPMPHASLAFLSACETARGDENLPDEIIHIAAAMLFAGFRGVVGTMWNIYDQDGPKVADVFYDNLFPTGLEVVVGSHPDGTKAALALHLAVAKLRADGASFQRWVPFIHLGC